MKIFEVAQGVYPGASGEDLQGYPTRRPAIVGAVGLGWGFVESPLRPQGGHGTKQVVAIARVTAAQDAPAGITSANATRRPHKERQA